MRYMCSFTLRIDAISFLCITLIDLTSLKVHHLVTGLYMGNKCTTIPNNDLCYVVLWTIILSCSFTFADAPKEEEIHSPSFLPTPQDSTDDTLGRWCTQAHGVLLMCSRGFTIITSCPPLFPYAPSQRRLPGYHRISNRHGEDRCLQPWTSPRAQPA